MKSKIFCFLSTLLTLLLAVALIPPGSGRSIEFLKDFLCISTHTDFKEEHSLTKPYHQTSAADIPHWDFSGNTVFAKDFIQLHRDHPGTFGLLWNTEPLRLKHWEVKLQLQIHDGSREKNENTENLSKDPGNPEKVGEKTPSDKWNDGLAFWFTNSSRLYNGPIFGSHDGFTGFAVVVEKKSEGQTDHTNQSMDNSFIYSLVSSDGNLKFEGNLDKYRNSGCISRLRNPVHDTWIRIRYSYNLLTVWVKGEKKAGKSESDEPDDEWTRCFHLKEVKLPESQHSTFHIGVSAATSSLNVGPSVDLHDLVALHTYEIEFEGRQIEEVEIEDDPRHMKMPDTILFVHPPVIPTNPGMSANVLVVPLVVLLVLVALCVAGTQMYPNPGDGSPYGQRRFH